MDGGGWGGAAKGSDAKRLLLLKGNVQQAATTDRGTEMLEAEGYEIRAEKVLGTFMITVRARFADEAGSRGWNDLLAFQTTAHNWSDPHLECQSLVLQIARRLE